MRKICTILAIFIVTIISKPATACTNLIVTKGASTDGSTFISYSADSHVLYGELYFWPAAKYKTGAMLNVVEWDSGKPLGQIPQVAQTYRVIGNMNEHSLAIGETTYGGRQELVDSTGIIDYGSLIYITLQRAKNAREAIKIMTELVATYGYYSSGESFSICDPNEAWILELIGKGVKYTEGSKENSNKGAVWVAVRIPDGYVSGHANQARIQTFTLENGTTSISSKNMDKIFDPNIEVVYAADVVSFAKDAGYYTGADKDFSFSDTYAPVDFSAARACDARVWSFFKGVNKDMWKYEDYALGHNLKNRMPLYIKPESKLSMQDVAFWMRDHYEGTKMDMTQDIGAGPFAIPYRWRPMSWEANGQTYCHERAIATQQTGFWFIAQCRSWLPNPIGGILWFGVDDAATSCLTPIYCSSARVPETFAVGNGDLLTYSDNAAFWVFSRVAATAYLRYDIVSADIKKVQQELEQQHQDAVKKMDEQALATYKNNPTKAIAMLTDFSVNTANDMVKRWKQLDNYLLVKYIDGNVKKEENGTFTRNAYGYPVGPKQPQLPEKWRKAIVNDNGETLKSGATSH